MTITVINEGGRILLRQAATRDNARTEVEIETNETVSVLVAVLRETVSEMSDADLHQLRVELNHICVKRPIIA